MKLKAVVALALASFAVNAMATTYNIGTLPVAPSIYSNVPTVAAGQFSDLYSFLFPAGASTASGSAVTVDVGTLLDINNLQVTLLDASFAALVSGGVGESSLLFNQPLTVGNAYYFQVSGFAAGSAGGAYAFLASAAPVPEPAAMALMLSGLALVGVAVRRRRQST